MTTYLFPGQGSQVKGMGDTLFTEFPDLTAQADSILGYSIQRLCLEDSEQQLNQTQYTQPALYMVNALSYLKKQQEVGQQLAYVAGHSLGEYNALFAAKVFDFATGLQLVKKRGELMSQATNGAMAAVLGLKVEKIKSILIEHGLMNVAIANDNSYMQIVISGQQDEVAKAQILCEQAEAKRVIPLKVSGAFHSPFMRPAQEKFAKFLSEFQFSPPSIPVVANYTARPYAAADIQKNLAEQITHPVRWTESMVYLLEQGETEFIEVGPGVVLTGLIRRIKNGG